MERQQQGEANTKLCVFFNTRQGCKRGKHCKYVHINRRGETLSTGVEDTYRRRLIHWLQSVGSSTRLSRVSVLQPPTESTTSWLSFRGLGVRGLGFRNFGVLGLGVQGFRG